MNDRKCNRSFSCAVSTSFTLRRNYKITIFLFFSLLLGSGVNMEQLCKNIGLYCKDIQQLTIFNDIQKIYLLFKFSHN